MNLFAARSALLVAALLLVADQVRPAEADTPNVIVIVSDDAGWADYGFMRDADPAADPGNQGEVPTPYLDQLADSGVVFTNAYTGSVCSPSRAMIATGQYGTRFGYALNISGSSSAINSTSIPQGLPTDVPTGWQYMQGAGYKTAVVGKWHLGAHGNGGGQLGNRPENMGVEFFQGLWSGSRDYTVGGVTGDGQLRETISDGAGSIASDGVIEGNYPGQYVTDVFGDQSADYIRDNADGTEPFYLYTSFTAPHTPMQATSSDLAYIDSLNEPGFTGNRRTYAAMQYAMDRNIGKMLEALDDPNNDGDDADSIRDDTLIVFINDNGGDCCDSGPNSSDNGDLRGGKGNQWEGGMRVPMIVAGAGVAPSAAGTVSEDIVHSVDIVPTALIGAGGASFAPGDVIDGVNLLPYINDEVDGVPHEDLFISRFASQQTAIRMGKWKYVYNDGRYQLYDLDADLDESNDVIGVSANAETVAELHVRLAGYHVQMDKPRHDNLADDTNQFDNFLFRESANSAALFSSATAWANADTGSGEFGANWTDGYANNTLTFRTKPTGDYSVTNDLNSVGGFGYMTNRITLTHQAAAALSTERTATIGGLPVMMTASLAGATPKIALDATDATPELFTFDVALDLEVYDDLEIGGDGNQKFLFSGEIRQVRAGRTLSKTGSAAVDLAAPVTVDTVDVDAGRVSFLDGSVNGALVARAGATLRVGGVGISPAEGGGDPGPAPEIVLAGLDLNYDAAADLSGDSIWSDSAGTADNLTFDGGAASVSSVNSAEFPQLTAAYPIAASGGASGLNSYFESGGPRSRQDATFEVVFYVADDAAGNDQVILEAGGQDRGVAMVLNDGVLTFNVDGDASDIEIDAPLTEGWHHAVGVIDLASGTDSLSFYLNNQLIGSLSGQTIEDWAGGNLLGLGAGASSVTGVSSGTGSAFHGEIALARYYANTAFSATDVEQNYDWLLYEAADEPDAPAVTLAIADEFTMEAGAVLEFDLLNTTEFDRVTVAGGASVAGDLLVSAADGFTAAAGDVFSILTASAVTGEFANTTLPALDAGLMWQVSYEPGATALVVTIAGDYNGDGVVDAADYTIFRDLLGQAVSPLTSADGDGDGVVTIADYGVWRANFGQEIPAPVSSVPEPTLLPLTLVGGWLSVTARSNGDRR